MIGSKPSPSPDCAILTRMARVSTDNACRLLKDAALRWEGWYRVLVNEHSCTVVFPPQIGTRAWSASARVTLIADAEGLNCWIEAVDVSKLDEIMVVIERQLNDHLSEIGRLLSTGTASAEASIVGQKASPRITTSSMQSRSKVGASCNQTLDESKIDVEQIPCNTSAHCRQWRRIETRPYIAVRPCEP
jgi:hypothetical protein